MRQNVTGKSRLAGALGLLTALTLVCIGVAAAGSAVFQLEGLAISSYSIAANGVTVGTVAFNQAANAIEPVALTSSSPGVASVPSSVPVIPPNDRVTFPVRGVSAGCTTIIAAHKDISKEQKIVVHPVNGEASFSLTVPARFLIAGNRSQGRVTTATIESSAVGLSSSNPTVASVPSRVETARGTVSFSIAGLREGCAIISATIRGRTVSKTVRVAAL
jgi:hypothetical protein